MHFLKFVEKLARSRATRDERDACPALVFVTHHVEEITPAFTHALLLREGRVLAQGPIESALTSRTLARAFGAPARLVRKGGRRGLRFGV